MDEMAAVMPNAGDLRDPAGCTDGAYANRSLKDLYLREMRYSAESLAATILVSRDDDSDFKLLLGVADSTTFNTRPTWQALDSYEQKCYIGDMDVRCSSFSLAQLRCQSLFPFETCIRTLFCKLMTEGAIMWIVIHVLRSVSCRGTIEFQGSC